MRKLILLVPVLLIALCLGALFFLSAPTTLEVDPQLKAIGMETPVQVAIANPHGVRSVKGFIEQGGNRYQVFEKTEPATRFLFFRKSVKPEQITFSAGKKQADKLIDGKAKLIVEATGNDLRGATTTVVRDVDVSTRPPSIVADGFQHYINQGGSELVTFTVGGYWTEAGVRVGKYTFRSFQLPGKGPEQRFSLFAYPWDLPEGTVPVVYARNPSGAEVTANFWTKIFPKKFRKRDLDVNDAFFQRVVPQIDKQGSSGDLLQRFLKVNGEVRRENNKVLADLRLQTADKFLWDGPFIQLGNSKVESQFADDRSYIYNGKKVDQQMHLGFDLSVTHNVPIQASNSGKVLLASELGIYGNCVVIDHGYGLQSIYGHLSSIDVKPGEMVKKGQVIGKSGATGLAGGDHLHYSMEVDGVQVNPVEWWDAHWINDRVLSKIESH